MIWREVPPPFNLLMMSSVSNALRQGVGALAEKTESGMCRYFTLLVSRCSKHKENRTRAEGERNHGLANH